MKQFTTEIPESVRWQIIGFIDGGNTYADCGKFYKIDPTTIGRIYSKYKKTGEITDKERSGRPKKMNEEDEKMILKELEDTQESTRKIGSLYDISHQTVLKLASEDNLLYKNPQIIPKLTSSHIKSRYDFCKNYQNVDNLNWFYCDESSFELFRSTSGVWTHDKYPQLPVKKTKQKLTVWAAIGKQGKTMICILKQGVIINIWKF